MNEEERREMNEEERRDMNEEERREENEEETLLTPSPRMQRVIKGKMTDSLCVHLLIDTLILRLIDQLIG